MPLVRIAGVKCFITIFLPNYGFCTVFIFQMKNFIFQMQRQERKKKSSIQELLVQCLYSNLHNARLINFLFSEEFSFPDKYN